MPAPAPILLLTTALLTGGLLRRGHAGVDGVRKSPRTLTGAAVVQLDLNAGGVAGDGLFDGVAEDLGGNLRCAAWLVQRSAAGLQLNSAR